MVSWHAHTWTQHWRMFYLSLVVYTVMKERLWHVFKVKSFILNVQKKRHHRSVCVSSGFTTIYWGSYTDGLMSQSTLLIIVPMWGSQASGPSNRKAGQRPWTAAWQAEGQNGCTSCLGTSLLEDDGSISQVLINQSRVTICWSRPMQRSSCSDKARQAIHQLGDRELDPCSPTLVEMTSHYWNV